MKTLPVEVLLKILSYSLQRNLFTSSKVCKQWYEIIFQPSFFSTIEIQSKNQLDKFIQFAKTKTIQGKHIGYYVHHITFEITTILHMEQIELILSTFPNIQSINGLYKYVDPFKACSYHLPIPQTLTHVSYWVTDEDIEWMKDLFSSNSNNNERIIKSLELDMRMDEFYHIDSIIPNTSFILPVIYTKNKSSSPNSDHQTTNTLLRELILPTLNHLSHLKLDFPIITTLVSDTNIAFDESLFENIHKSCSQLESLDLNGFSFNITNDFNTTIMNHNNGNMLQPAYSLKKLAVKSEFTIPNCYIYISKKYPQIESLTLNLNATPIPSMVSEQYKQAIYTMLNQFHLLKKMKIILYNSSNTNSRDEKLCPYDEMILWLLQHPSQIENLTYYSSIIKKYYYGNESYGLLQNKPYEDVINNIVHQHGFLNHLTHLSLTGDYLTDILYNYLLQNNHQTIVLSTSIKELVIINKYQYHCINFVFIHDYLDCFPNLDSLQLRHCTVVNNNDDFNAYFDIQTRGYNSNTTKLHDLISQRKQKHILASSNGEYVYNLRSLSFEDCTIFMKGGLNNLLNKNSRIKQLKFKRIRYKNEKLSPEHTDDFIDLSNLSLYALQIIHFYYITGSINSNSRLDRSTVTKLTLTETAINKKTIIKASPPSSPSSSSLDNVQPYPSINLHLTCQYINKIAFESPDFERP
ncbi:unnamed protein product [Cunninghamella blakesleeana]